MKFLRKRVLPFLLCTLLMITMIPNVAFASGNNTKDSSNDYGDPTEEYKNGSCGLNVKYHYDDDGTLTISGVGPMYNYATEPMNYQLINQNVDIKTKPWQSLDVKKVIIQDGVTSIGSGMFAESNISEISIPNTVTDIGCLAFYCCQKLQKVTIPYSVKKIGTAAFYYTPLQSITIPDSVKQLGIFTFASCWKLTKVSLSKQLTTIPESTFMYCGMETVTIPENITSIGENAFYSCNNLRKVTIPKTVEYISYTAFECDAVTIYGDGGSAAQNYAINMNIPFVAMNSFKVIFQDDDGTILSEQTVPYGQPAVEPEAPSKEGDAYTTYEFIGWDTDYYEYYEVTSDMVITAVYDVKQVMHTVTFDANGGTSQDYKEVVLPHGSQLESLPNCTRKGYKLKGWYTDPKKGEKVTAETVVTGDMVLYAHWKR